MIQLVNAFLLSEYILLFRGNYTYFLVQVATCYYDFLLLSVEVSIFSWNLLELVNSTPIQLRTTNSILGHVTENQPVLVRFSILVWGPNLLTCAIYFLFFWVKYENFNLLLFLSNLKLVICFPLFIYLLLFNFLDSFLTSFSILIDWLFPSQAKLQ